MAILKVPENSYRWLLAELLVIVLGILIAFQVEEYRENLRNRDREESILIGMMEDYEFNKDLLARYGESLSCLVGYFVSYKDTLVSSNDQKSEELISMNTGCVDFYWRPSYPSYQGWRDLGEPELISNESLRKNLNDFHEGFSPFMISITQEYRNISTRVDQAQSIDYELNIVKSLDNDNSFERSGDLLYPLRDMPRHPEFFERVDTFLRSALDIIPFTQEGIGRIESLEKEIGDHLESMQ